MAEDVVGDEELLYRRIPQGRGLYSRTLDGRLEFSSQLFADREKVPRLTARTSATPIRPTPNMIHPTALSVLSPVTCVE